VLDSPVCNSRSLSVGVEQDPLSGVSMPNELRGQADAPTTKSGSTTRVSARAHLGGRLEAGSQSTAVTVIGELRQGPKLAALYSITWPRNRAEANYLA